MSGFGFCRDTSSSSTGLVATTRIVAGSQTISAGQILQEDGTGVLDEEGGQILQDSAPPSTGTEVDILAEDDTRVLTEDGGHLLDESSSSSSTTPGSATPLVYVATPCQYVVVAAKSTNTGDIWISGSDVEVGLGIPLLVGEDNVQLPIDDVAKVYIIGNIGDGVIFVYGTTSVEGQLVDDDGNLVFDDDGNPVIG